MPDTAAPRPAPPHPAVAADLKDENINPYCSLDEKDGKKKTMGEMEGEYLGALQDFYFNGTASMSDEEFDNLKEELMWEGSSVVIMDSDEQRFLEATEAYFAGKPVLSDADFDALKMRLMEKGSKIAIAGPRCSLRSQKVYSDLSVDYLKLTAINVPAALLILGGLFVLDDISGFNITKAIELPQPLGTVVLWAIVFPTIYILTDALTKVALKDALILKGPCTNCSEEVNVFFGDILGVEGNKVSDGDTEVMCDKCKVKMTADPLKRRLVEIPQKAKKKKAKAKAR